MTAVLVPLQKLPDVWLEKARELEPFAPPAAVAYRQAAQDLRATLKSSENSVTLRQAHELGGYSIDYLQKVVKAGTIENVGTKGRIKIRRRDVPMKPGHGALRAESAPRQLRPSAVVASAIAGGKR